MARRAEKEIRALRQHALPMLAAVVCAVIVATGLTQVGPLRQIEQDTVDTRFDIRGARTPSNRVVLVALDDRSLDLLARRPPLPRTLHARLLDRLRVAGAKVIAYDVQFSEPTSERADQALYQAVDRARPVVLATTEITDDGDTRVLGSTANVTEVGGRVGAALYPLDDGMFRRVTRRAAGIETFAAQTARLAGAPATVAAIPARGVLIDYAGPAGTLPTFSFADVLNERVHAEKLHGKVVVVGVTAATEHDFHVTPAPGPALMSGLEIQGNAIATLLEGLPLRDVSGIANLALLVLLSLAGAVAGTRLEPPAALAAATATLAAYLLTAQLSFDAGAVIDTVAPTLGITASCLVAVANSQRAVRRDHARLAALVERLAPGHHVDDMIARAAGPGAAGVLSPGSELGPYRIDEPLGLGGMGVVYRAKHEHLDRATAIKVISPALNDDEEIRERLRREALNAARLEHPNIVAIHDAGTVDRRAYIAMQLVEGRSLFEIARAHELTPARIAQIVEMVAAGLDHAHARGIVHRDVKPHNILVEEATGRALLADFGIASAAGQERLTNVGDLVGTVAYAAPEQLGGAEPQPAADVYALGCVLYELLTRELPFGRPTLPAAIHAHLSEPPPSVSALRSELSGTGIDEVIMRALAKIPSERWSTAGALAAATSAAIGAVVTNSAVDATPQLPSSLGATLPR